MLLVLGLIGQCFSDPKPASVTPPANRLAAEAERKAHRQDLEASKKVGQVRVGSEKDQLDSMDIGRMTAAQKLARLHYGYGGPPETKAVYRCTQALNHIASNTVAEKAPPEDMITKTYQILNESFPGEISLVYIAEDLASLVPKSGTKIKLSEVCALYIQAVKSDGGQRPR